MNISPMDEARQPAPLGHSGFGIASFILVFVFWAGDLALFVTAGVMDVSSPDGLDENSPAVCVFGLLFIFSVFGTLIGLGLGIGGLAQKDRLKIFAILGVIFHALTFLGLVGLIVLGAAVS